MNDEKNGGPAFPSLHVFTDRDGEVSSERIEGMDLRDYIAVKAMQSWFPVWERDQDFDLCRRSYRLADAMLSERNKS